MLFQKIAVAGQRYGSLVIQQDAPPRNKRRFVLCACDCGRQKEIRLDALRSGKTTCCGCQTAGVRIPCKNCGKQMLACNKNTFCSKKCRFEAKHTERTCLKCGKNFKVRFSAVSEKTNASGNYCSRGCYNDSMVKDPHGDSHSMPRGSRWNKIRKETLRRLPFCVLCGRKSALQVHHIIPYRLTKDNDASNLVTVCRTHHYQVEKYTRDLLGFTVDYATMKKLLGIIFMDKAFETINAISVALNQQDQDERCAAP